MKAPVTEEQLDLAEEMLVLARLIVGELENAETVETAEDADASIECARDLAKRILEMKP